MNNLFTLTVLIPFFNEINTLSKSVDRILKNDIYKEIILIDNFSNDGSTDVAINLSNKYEKVKFHRTNSNNGKGGAINSCKELVTSSHVVIHDADLEYFPDDILDMKILAEKNPFCLILGSRFIGNKERKNVYFRTLIANKTMSLFFSIVNNYRVTDVATCYKLFPVDFFKSTQFLEEGFSIEIELLTKFLKFNKKILEVPIKYEGRTYAEGKKITSYDGIKYLYNTLKYKFLS